MTVSALRRTALLLALLPTLALAKEWALDKSKSTLGFSGTYQGEKFTGKFGKFDTSIDYDAADPSKAKFDVTVDVTSAATGNADYDGQIKTADFFDFAKFPKAHFVTTAVRKDGAKVIADGQLTIRDKTQPVSLAVTFAEAGGGATLDVAITLKRLDFGVGGGDWADTKVIANEVPVTGHLVLTPKPGG